MGSLGIINFIEHENCNIRVVKKGDVVLIKNNPSKLLAKRMIRSNALNAELTHKLNH